MTAPFTARADRPTTWADVQHLLSHRRLPYTLVRFTVDGGGCIIDWNTGATVAQTVQEAEALLKGTQ